jgi:CheY-like chemotaxis protein
MNVLLVDDEIGIVTVYTLILESAGFRVYSAENGLEGWETFERGSAWDIAILDRAMPVMNGEELAAKIKATSPDLPIIMISGLVDAIEDPSLFHDILSKPFSPSELLNSIASALEISSAAIVR